MHNQMKLEISLFLVKLFCTHIKKIVLMEKNVHTLQKNNKVSKFIYLFTA